MFNEIPVHDANMSRPLLSVRDLVIAFPGDDGPVRAVDGIGFDIARGRTVALVGESGSGKTVTAHSIMRLLPMPPARLEAGQIVFDGKDLISLSAREMRALRGAQISIVFQDPTAALNPVYSVGSQLVEAFRIHTPISRAEARRQAVELLRKVGFPQPEQRFHDYPHELSGGMRQRVMIAMALACSPLLLIADEPTSALDMLAAAQITALLADLRRDLNMSLLLISHDLGVVAEVADEIVVVFAGQVVEHGSRSEVLTQARHPYTRSLLRAIPPPRRRQRRRRPTPTRLPTMENFSSDPRRRTSACRFADRCSGVHDRCNDESPPLFDLLGADGQPVAVRCWLVEAEATAPSSVSSGNSAETAPSASGEPS